MWEPRGVLRPDVSSPPRLIATTVPLAFSGMTPTDPIPALPLLLPPESGSPPALAFRVQTGDGKVYHAYEYPHPAVAATVVLHDVNRGAFLLVRRAREPFAGCFAFPGGFLEVGLERIEETAARELFEETGVEVDPDALRLIDVRSDPRRDPRDHVFDIAYYIERENVEAEALDETDAIHWATPEELDKGLPLAFDHSELWRNTRTRYLARKNGTNGSPVRTAEAARNR